MQITLAAQEELAVVQLTSPLAYFFIPPEFLSVPPFLFSIYHTLYHAMSDTSSYMHLHAYSGYLPPVLSYIPIVVGFGNRTSESRRSFMPRGRRGLSLVWRKVVM